MVQSSAEGAAGKGPLVQGTGKMSSEVATCALRVSEVGGVRHFPLNRSSSLSRGNGDGIQDEF